MGVCGYCSGFWNVTAQRLSMYGKVNSFGNGDYGRYLLLPSPRLPFFKARYHFLLAQAETGVPRISPVSNQGAPMEPVQLSTIQGIVTPRYNNKKEPTPQVMA